MPCTITFHQIKFKLSTPVQKKLFVKNCIKINCKSYHVLNRMGERDRDVLLANCYTMYYPLFLEEWDSHKNKIRQQQKKR
jgi:hypothetical protein